VLEYFAPLQAWLKQQNEGRSCGWTGTTTAVATVKPSTPKPAPNALIGK